MGFLDSAKKAAQKAKDEAIKAGQTAKLKGEIVMKERDVTNRKGRFGVEFYDAVIKNNPSSPTDSFNGSWSVAEEPFGRAHAYIVEKQAQKASHKKKLDVAQGKDNSNAGAVLSNAATVTKKSGQIAILDQKIKTKKEGLGLEIFAKLPDSMVGLPAGIHPCLESAMKDIGVIEGKIKKKQAKIVSKNSTNIGNSHKPMDGGSSHTTTNGTVQKRSGRSRSPMPKKTPTATPVTAVQAQKRSDRCRSPMPKTPLKTTPVAAVPTNSSRNPILTAPANPVNTNSTGGRSRSKDPAKGRSRSRSRDPTKQKDKNSKAPTTPTINEKRPDRSSVSTKKTDTPIVARFPTAGQKAKFVPANLGDATSNKAIAPVTASPVKTTSPVTAVPVKKTHSSNHTDVDPVAAALGVFGISIKGNGFQTKFAKSGLIDDGDDDDGSLYGRSPIIAPVQKNPVQAFAIPIEADDKELDLDPRWKLQDMKFNGKTRCLKKGKADKVRGLIAQGIREFKRNPEKYVAIYYQSEMLGWGDITKQKYTLIHREGTVNWKPADVTPEGILNLLWYTYERCTPLPFDIFPREYRDSFTDEMIFHGRKIHSEIRKPVLPGRGMGCGDIPELKLMGKVGPEDIIQGSVGNCWLLSSISALAEFPGAIKKLFRKNRNIYDMPADAPNTYTITLWDLKTWKEVDIEVDERLCANPDKKKLLLGAKPAPDGSLWGAYLEKALAAHVGGWEKIEGGQPAHAFSLLTGTNNQYTIKMNESTRKFKCMGQFDSNTNKWADQCNSPHDTCKTFWPMAWPEVGGGGEGEITKDDLFLKMVAWDKVDFVVVAWTLGESDSNTTDGLVDIHAYSVIQSICNVAGTNLDLVKVRNPWGKGEMRSGQFSDRGPGWEEYPEIKDLIKPISGDDGILWMTKEEFFVYFKNICVCATSMSQYSD